MNEQNYASSFGMICVEVMGFNFVVKQNEARCSFVLRFPEKCPSVVHNNRAPCFVGGR